eukprot:3476121-Pleurochrysis_carterae.AAC.3
MLEADLRAHPPEQMKVQRRGTSRPEQACSGLRLQRVHMCAFRDRDIWFPGRACAHVSAWAFEC